MSSPSSGRSAGNSKDRLVQFRLGDAERIAKAVSAIEGARRQPKGSVLPRAAAASEITLGSFTGAWSIGQEKAVRIQTDSNVTTSVVNHFHPNISFSRNSRPCAFSGGVLVLVRC